MIKSSRVFLLCSLLSVPFLGFSSAHAASFVNATAGNTGPCLEVLNANISSGTGAVDAYTCNGTFAQQWNFEGVIVQGLGTTSSGAYCLDVFANGTANGTAVDYTHCNGTTAQQWYYVNHALVASHANKCLDVGTGSVPLPAVINTCNGSAGQIWSIRE